MRDSQARQKRRKRGVSAAVCKTTLAISDASLRDVISAFSVIALMDLLTHNCTHIINFTNGLVYISHQCSRVCGVLLIISVLRVSEQYTFSHHFMHFIGYIGKFYIITDK